MFGWRRGGWGRGGFGWVGSGRQVHPPKYSEEFEYIGPCRCGFGPNAFYRDKKSGRIIHWHDLWRQGIYQAKEENDVKQEETAKKMNESQNQN